MRHFRTLLSLMLAMFLVFTGFVFSGVDTFDVRAAAAVCDASLPYEVSSIP
jgi:hypothetical protein